MNVFIVHAHPEPQSFSSSMAMTATETLRAQGHEVRVSDLYAMQFNPVASAADFGQRKNPDYLVYALEQRHNWEAGTLSPDIQAEIAKLLWCDMLILNFPVYWFSVPAILKGWIDRVLVSGLVYGGKRFYDRGGLSGKRAALSVTIGGQRHMLQAGGVHGALDDMLRPLLRGTLAYTGLQVLPPFVGWHVPYIGADARADLMREFRTYLERLPDAAPLDFPRLEQFDEQLRPLPGAT
ncbi:MAG: NAD(P)H-dependent oxidoreductase [Pseudomonadota bacterium]